MNIQSSSGSSVSATHSQSLPVIKELVEPNKSIQPETIVKILPTGRQLENAEFQGRKISVGDEQLIKAIDRAIKALEGPQTTFEMKVHEQTHAVIVKVFNKETGELIREIPPEKTLDLVVKMMEFAGILVDEKA